MTILPLVRFYLRRYRALFLAVLLLALLHEATFLFLFQFWKKHAQFSDWIVSILPGRIREGMGIPIHDLTDPRTYKALVMMRPDARALPLVFGIALGTDVIAGESGRGTADLLFTHPVRRAAAVFAGAIAMLVHLAALGATMLLGYALLSRLLPMGPRQPSIAAAAPSIALAMAGSAAIGATAFLMGSLCARRGRAIGLTLVLVLVPMVLDFMGIFTSALTHVARLFPEHYYRPHAVLLGMPEPSLGACLAPLAAIGVSAIALAALLAERRDL